MLGTLRFILACLVVLNHLWLPTANKMGAHAVIAFYVISGYLMTKILHETYQFSPSGIRHFLVNRWLRIFPPYLFFLALAVVLLILFPTTFGQTYSSMKLPDNGLDWFRNITLIDLPRADAAVIPPGWTLTIECFFYLAMPLALSRNKKIAVSWLVISALYAGYLLISGAPFSRRYTPASAASLFFSLGACLYLFWPYAKAMKPPAWLAALALPIYCVWPLLTDMAGLEHTTWGFYPAIVPFLIVLVYSLIVAPINWRQQDRVLGDLAYPVFIVHFLAAGIVRIFWPASVAPYSALFLALSFAISVALSLAYTFGAKRIIDPLRTRIRGKDVSIA